MIGPFHIFWFLPRVETGCIVVAPSEETVEVETGFTPRRVNAHFSRRGADCYGGGPSCAKLVDEIYDIEVIEGGFRFKYKVESGIRFITWKAKR